MTKKQLDQYHLYLIGDDCGQFRLRSLSFQTFLIFFLYCTVSACDVRAATLTEVFP
jgi:hypothetical protein